MKTRAQKSIALRGYKRLLSLTGKQVRRLYWTPCVYVLSSKDGEVLYIGSGKNGAGVRPLNSDHEFLCNMKDTDTLEIFECDDRATVRSLEDRVKKELKPKWNRGVDGWSDEQRANHAALMGSPEVRTRVRRGVRSAMKRPEYRANLSAGLKRYWAIPENHAKHRARLQHPETRARMSASAKRRMSRPGERARRSAATKAAFERPEVRAKHAASLKRPETRARMSTSAKRRKQS